MDVPLHVALRGIEKAFDSWESKPRTRTVKSLLYCQEEVEAQYAEWRESRVGAACEPEAQSENGAGQKSDAESLPFSRPAILEYLKRGRARLDAARNERKKTGDDDLSDALERAIALLKDLEQDFASVALPNAQKLEDSLSGVERMLSDSLRTVVSSKKVHDITAEVKDQLRPYQKHMKPAVYQQTIDNLLLKRLREQFAVPRLSLFYL